MTEPMTCGKCVLRERDEHDHMWCMVEEACLADAIDNGNDTCHCDPERQAKWLEQNPEVRELLRELVEEYDSDSTLHAESSCYFCDADYDMDHKCKHADDCLITRARKIGGKE